MAVENCTVHSAPIPVAVETYLEAQQVRAAELACLLGLLDRKIKYDGGLLLAHRIALDLSNALDIVNLRQVGRSGQAVAS